MPSIIGKCKLFRIKHTTLLEGETFLRNKHKIAFFLNKVHIFLVEKKTPLNCIQKQSILYPTPYQKKKWWDSQLKKNLAA